MDDRFATAHRSLIVALLLVAGAGCGGGSAPGSYGDGGSRDAPLAADAARDVLSSGEDAPADDVGPGEDAAEPDGPADGDTAADAPRSDATHDGSGADGGQQDASGADAGQRDVGGADAGGSDVGGTDSGQDATPDAQTGAPCTTDADCSAGWSCQVVVNAAGTALELRCAPYAGTRTAGSTCTAGTDCRSGQCQDGYCSAACVGPSDCPAAAHCAATTVTVGGLSGSFPLCRTAPCTSSAACDPGEVCSDVRSVSGSIAAFCQQPGTGGSDLGAACTTYSTCNSLLCNWQQVCTVVCSGAADCTAVANGVCADTYTSGSTVIETCATGCARAADCATGVCAYDTDTAGNRVQFVCSPPYGSGATGADCSTTNNCATGLCLSNYNGATLVDQICTQPCLTGADCPAGYTNCVTVNLTVPSGGSTQAVGLCDHP